MVPSLSPGACAQEDVQKPAVREDGPVPRPSLFCHSVLTTVPDRSRSARSFRGPGSQDGLVHVCPCVSLSFVSLMLRSQLSGPPGLATESAGIVRSEHVGPCPQGRDSLRALTPVHLAWASSFTACSE